VYDCDSCEFQQKRGLLTSEDKEALLLHSLLSRSSVRELRLTEMVFDALGITVNNRSEILGLLNQLDLIHRLTPMEPHRPPVNSTDDDD
jgi:hypothetical protein